MAKDGERAYCISASKYRMVVAAVDLRCSPLILLMLDIKIAERTTEIRIIRLKHNTKIWDERDTRFLFHDRASLGNNAFAGLSGFSRPPIVQAV
jgi:hypothetical protein